MKKKWLIIGALCLCLFIVKNSTTAHGNVYRIAGKNRYETANIIAGQFEWSGYAVVVSGSSYADALSAGPYAANIGGNIFLSDENVDLTDTLKHYKATVIIIIGGENAVSENVENRLRENFTVYRIAGKDRYETSELVNRQTESKPIPVGVATGRNFPDALSAGAFMANKGYGLQLVDGLNPYILPDDFRGMYTFGGTASMVYGVGERIQGSNRYETAARIADIIGSYNSVVVASGENFPDALSVTPFAKSINAPIILTAKDKLPPSSKEAIAKADNIYIIGGENAISKRVEDEILGKTPEPPVEPEPPVNPEPPVPSKPVPVTKNGITTIDGIILASKKYSLPSTYNPGINQNTLDYFGRMQRAAAAQGLSITIGSGFRSYTYQKSLYEGYVRQYGRAYADRISARPGHSEHQTGYAIDVRGTSNYLNQRFGTTREGLWMAANAHKYGFILRYPNGKEHITGYIFEPWHFRFVGLNLAPKIYQSGLTVEEYYGL